MAIPGVEEHDYRKKSLFDRAKEAINAHYEHEREERPIKIKELQERTKLVRAEAGYERAVRARDKVRGRGGGMMFGGGDFGELFVGTSKRRKRSASMFDW